MANWDVFRELDNLRREIDEAFRGVGIYRPLASTFLSPVATSRFPLVNFSEDEGHVYVDALVPGVDPSHGNDVAFTMEQAFADANTDLPARVFFGVGANEDHDGRQREAEDDGQPGRGKETEQRGSRIRFRSACAT